MGIEDIFEMIEECEERAGEDSFKVRHPAFPKQYYMACLFGEKAANLCPACDVQKFRIKRFFGEYCEDIYVCKFAQARLIAERGSGQNGNQ